MHDSGTAPAVRCPCRGLATPESRPDGVYDEVTGITACSYGRSRRRPNRRMTAGRELHVDPSIEDVDGTADESAANA